MKKLLFASVFSLLIFGCSKSNPTSVTANVIDASALGSCNIAFVDSLGNLFSPGLELQNVTCHQCDSIAADRKNIVTPPPTSEIAEFTAYTKLTNF
jgi:hypothetical protein